MKRTYKDISYTLTRNNRKTASIHIERDGEVSILVPTKLSNAEVDEVIEKKLVWIYKNLAEWCDLNATKVEREFVNGEGFLYLGRSYRLKLVEDQAHPLTLRNGYFCLRTGSNGKKVDAHEVFKEFYREKALQKVTERVEFYAPQMGVTPKGINVQELQHRWASCTKAGMLNFHWKCMMAPLTILDYFVVHELAHLIHANHTDAFWNEVDKVLPDYLDRKQWLRVNGAGMSL
ncbi:MAG: M48 family metallopeptidase [Planctomycetaceae bacterium]|nr:M48 family metallopeptidase [Planctomycetaceae bacterium]